MTTEQHPLELELIQFAQGALPDLDFERIAAHLEHCAPCAEFLRGLQLAFKPGEAVTTHKPITEGPGSVIGPYKLLQQLGEGGMGVVYMAEQEKPVRRIVALKIIKPGMDSRQVIARFEAERQALAMMDHHNIARVLDANTTDSGRPYFVMELIKGIPITDFCDKNQLTPRERLELFIPVCLAIQHAHQKGIIHRDIKPTNVLVTLYDGTPVPKVIDFGIAKATQKKLTDRTMFTGIGQIMGTLEYMSPEQAEMNQLDIDTRSDVYSLGALLYELLTGSTPITRQQFREVGFDEMLRTIRETEPPKPSTRLSDSGDALPSISAVRKTEPAKLSKLLRGDLDWIVMKALDKQRSRRYETASGLARDVERYLAGEPVEAGPPSATYRLRKYVRKNRRALSVAAAFAIVLCLGTIISTWQAIRANYSAAAAQTAEDEAKTERDRARAAEGQAQSERDRAKAAEGKAKEESAQRLADLVQSHVSTGTRWLEEENYPEASLYFAEALRLDQGDPTRERFHRMRCASTLQACIKPAAMWNTNMPVHGLAVSDDETLVVTFQGRIFVEGQAGEARVWEIKTGKLIATLRHDNDVQDAAFSPDGRYVATASNDHTARIWESVTGRPVGPVLQDDLSVFRVVFNHAGDRLATASGAFLPFGVDSDEPYPDRKKVVAKIWSVPDGDLVFNLPLNDFVRDMRFSPDDKLLATASRDSMVRLWNTATGQLDGKPIEHANAAGEELPAIGSVQFTSDGKRLITSANWPPLRTWIWDVDSRKMFSGPYEGFFVDIDREETQLLTQSLSDDHNGLLLSFVREGVVAGSSLIQPGLHTEARLSPSGHQLILTETAGSGVVLLDTRSKEIVTPPLNHSGGAVAARYIWKGRGVISLDADGLVRVWDLASSAVPGRGIITDLDFHTQAFSPNGKLVSVSVQDGRTQVIDLLTGQKLGNVLPGNPHDRSVFNSDGSLLLTYGRGNPQIWNVRTGQRIGTLQREPANQLNVKSGLVDDLIRHATFSPDGKFVAIAAIDGARVWDIAIGMWATPPLKHSSPLSHVAFSPGGNRVVTSAGVDLPGKTGEARVWEISTGEAVSPILKHDAPVTWAEFSPDGQRVVTACGHENPEKCTAQVWEVDTGRRVATMQHRATISQATFSSDGMQVISVSRDGTVQKWNADTGKFVAPPMRQNGASYCQMVVRDNILLTVALRPFARERSQLWDMTTGQPLTIPMITGEPATISGNGESLLCSDAGEIRIIPIAVDNRSVEDILATAELLSGYRLDPQAGRIPLTASDFLARFRTVGNNSPSYWTSSPEQVTNWKRHEGD